MLFVVNKLTRPGARFLNNFQTRLLRKIARMGGVFGNSIHAERAIVRRRKSATFLDHLAFDLHPRPHYAYGLYHAAMEAKALGLSRISAIEFGVAGGAGLKEMENYALQVQPLTGIEIQLFGFDTLTGMPPPTDYRDMPYVWATGLFRPTPKIIESFVKTPTMVIGDVRETVGGFIKNHNPAPIGFVSFDLDYYSSTVAALSLFGGQESSILPRVYCYFDDIIGDDHELHSEFTGELLAIREFNDAHAMRKVAPIHGLRHKRLIPSGWNDVMYVMHAFDHSRYNTYTNPRWKAPAAKRAPQSMAATRPGAATEPKPTHSATHANS